MVRGTEDPSRGTLQGTYAFAPGGQLLGRINSSSADATRKVLERALTRFAKLPKSARTLRDPKVVTPKRRWEDSYPADGLVLQRFVRDLPRDGKPEAEPAKAFNIDAVWFAKSELRKWLPENLEVGVYAPIHTVISLRLAQFAIVDNVRGQTLPYHESEIVDLSIISTITKIDGDKIEISLKGDTRSIAKGPWKFGDNYWKPSKRHEWPHAIATWVLGKATYDKKTGRFDSFEMIALGGRTGSTHNNGRGREAKPRGIGFVFRMAPKHWRVAPTFINLYDVDWVKAPR